jgi:hypothetical protein
VGGTELIGEEAERREISGAEEQRTGAMGGTEVGPEVPQKTTQGRRQKQTIPPSSAGKPAGSQMELGGQPNTRGKERSFHPWWLRTGMSASRPSHYGQVRNNGQTENICRAGAEARHGGNHQLTPTGRTCPIQYKPNTHKYHTEHRAAFVIDEDGNAT